MTVSTWVGVARPGRAAAGVAGIVLVALLAVAGRTTLWDRDEPRFARAAVEMVESGQYLYPTFNGEPRVQKPILIYWLMALSVGLLGPTELAVRFWSPIGITVAALFTFGIGRRLFGPPVGLIAMVLLVLTPLVWMEGVAATADAVLLAALSAALWCLVTMASTGGRLATTLGLTAALVVAQLVKGPVALAAPLSAFAGVWLLARADLDRRVAIHAAAATVASIGCFLLWFVPANAATGGRFWTTGILNEVVARGFRPLEGHGGPLLLWLPFYLVVLGIGFAPWIAYLPSAAAGLLRGDLVGARPVRALLLGWIVIPFVAFSLAATKLPHYLLPLWPALSVLVAGALARIGTAVATPPEYLWLRRGGWCLAVLMACEVAAIVALGVTRADRSIGLSLAVALVAALVASGRALRLHRGGRHRAGAAWLAGGAVAVAAVVGMLVLPALERLKPVPVIAAAVHAATPSSVPVASYGFAEPSLDFYIGRAPILPLPSGEAVRLWSELPGPGVLVTTTPRLDELTGRGRPMRLAPIATAAGIDAGNLEWVELVALRRTGVSPVPHAQ